ncbi:MAG: A/G-specific adenine glycosylase [Acidobacteria bacterium]|nr:A/G-specific adenine glycosylase [Acidobacteriota bacterium]
MTVRHRRGALLRWYRAHRRDLPWRGAADPYAIWVSEIMLQQTQVKTVRPYYTAFLERFPNIAALAAAAEDDVLAQWTGLGYYRRARSLHRGAREILRLHGGRLPSDAATLRTLPGIGRYTAGAIASIAFDRAEPILDGNVRRVLARWFGVDGAKLGKGEEEKRLWELADRLVHGAAPGDLNQALMELGATICLPREPICPACPVRNACFARAHDAVGRLPSATPRKKSVTVRVGVAVIRRAGKVLLERPDATNPLRGTWDLPAVELDGSGFATEALTRRFDQRHRVAVTMGACLGRTTHGILHRRLKLEAHGGTLRRGRVGESKNLAWVALDALGNHPVSGATHKVLQLAT